jgi:DNA-binding response OmpR family regulator
MSLKKKILYIEDEPFLAKVVKETLTLKGYEVLHKHHGMHLSEILKQFVPDVCILDVMLPHIDGYTLAKHIRNVYPQTPIIFLTAKTQTQDLVTGFESGGTDYIRKPFSMDELAIRIETQYKIAHQQEARAVVADNYTIGDWIFYPNRMLLQKGAHTQSLSQRENQILTLLCQHIGKTLSRRVLMQKVWGDDNFFNSRNLDVYIKKLRNFFRDTEGVAIVTLKGEGYLFTCTH